MHCQSQHLNQVKNLLQKIVAVEPSEALSRRGDSPPADAQPKPVAQPKPKPGTSRGGGSSSSRPYLKKQTAG